mmetsp:Transcript_7173/g.19629  ORF Transcript_7173/g.19629 Transcript_7173/m.19629 type:complete len:207 (+) Transcript_7173:679-1299(+)
MSPGHLNIAADLAFGAPRVPSRDAARIRSHGTRPLWGRLIRCIPPRCRQGPAGCKPASKGALGFVCWRNCSRTRGHAHAFRDHGLVLVSGHDLEPYGLLLPQHAVPAHAAPPDKGHAAGPSCPSGSSAFVARRAHVRGGVRAERYRSERRRFCRRHDRTCEIAQLPDGPQRAGVVGGGVLIRLPVPFRSTDAAGEGLSRSHRPLCE